MKYIILDNNSTKIGSAKNKQELYSIWEDLINTHRKLGSFDCAAGFSMWLRDNTRINAFDSKNKIPRYDRNEWKQ